MVVLLVITAVVVCGALGFNIYSILNADTGEGTTDTVLTLEFTTESGFQGIFETLYIEEVNINLLAADAMTGATPIQFIAE